MGTALAAGFTPEAGGTLQAAIREATVMGIFDGWLGQLYSSFHDTSMDRTGYEYEDPAASYGRR